MKKMTYCMSALFGALAAGWTAWAIAQQPILRPGDSDEISVLMRAKLSCTQQVVEGLMSGDFNQIRKGGVDLQKICDASSWRAHDDQIYGHYRAELKRAAIKLVTQAANQNLDGAAYGYMHTLTTCINCHDHCRNVLRIADSNFPMKVVPIPVTEQENANQQALQSRTVWR